MTHVEMDNALRDFAEEYWDTEELAGYRQRLKAFFKNNDVPKDLKDKFFIVFESFYMAYGFEILSDDDTPNEAFLAASKTVG